MGLLKRAEDLKQNLSVAGLLDIVIDICRKIEPKTPDMLDEPNVVISKEKKKK